MRRQAITPTDQFTDKFTCLHLYVLVDVNGDIDRRYPPDVLLGLGDGRISATLVGLALVPVIAAADVLLFGFPETVIPYNYPFFGDILLLWLAVLLLERSHAVLQRVSQELVSLARNTRNDPLALHPPIDPDGISRELSNVIYLSYHPGVLLLGGAVGGGFVFVVMWALGVISEYPYLLLDFGFGAAHGVFFGPLVGALYIFARSSRHYIVDINLLDPDGVGGYREIGNGIVTLATYGIVLITVDFVILSSVAFTRFTEFQLVVTALFLLLLGLFVAATFASTFIIRRELLQIRDHKIALMQETFNRREEQYWLKHNRGEAVLTEAVDILTIYAMFHQMSRMSMWPINVYSLTRLALSVGFSLAVLLVENTGFLL